MFAKAALAAAALAIVLAVGYMGGRLLEEKKYPEIRGEMSAGFGEVPKVEIDGVTYEQKMDVTSLLMIGIDKASTDEIKGYRDGGPVGFPAAAGARPQKQDHSPAANRSRHDDVGQRSRPVWQQRGLARSCRFVFPTATAWIARNDAKIRSGRLKGC